MTVRFILLSANVLSAELLTSLAKEAGVSVTVEEPSVQNRIVDLPPPEILVSASGKGERSAKQFPFGGKPSKRQVFALPPGQSVKYGQGLMSHNRHLNRSRKKF